MSDTDSKRQHLSAFLRGPTFVVLTYNGSDPSPHGPFEAWAYRGPLDFAAAEPIKFGVGENPIDAVAALGNMLTSKEAEIGGKGTPILVGMTDRELATILAALRFHQDENLHSDGIADKAIEEIATDGGNLAPLSFDEVGQLCERLNFSSSKAAASKLSRSEQPSIMHPGIQQIQDLLYLDTVDDRKFYDPDKEWDADTTAMVAEVVSQYIPRPHPLPEKGGER